MPLENESGFSLVELIIVIVIMAILIGIVASQVIPYITKSRKSKDKQKLSTIHTGFVTELAEKGYDEIAEDLFGSVNSADAKKFFKKSNVTSGIGDGIVFMKMKDGHPANATGSTNGWDDDGFFGFPITSCGLELDEIAGHSSYNTGYTMPLQSKSLMGSNEVEFHVYLDCDSAYSPVMYLTWKNGAPTPSDENFFFFD